VGKVLSCESHPRMRGLIADPVIATIQAQERENENGRIFH